LGLAHFVASAYRSGSPLLALDLGFLATAGVGFGLLLKWIVYAGADGALQAFLPRIIVGGALVFLLGSLAQLSVGRTDARRGHGALSGAVWTLGAILFLGSFLWCRSVLEVTPQQVGGTGEMLSGTGPVGTAIVFRGSYRAHDYSPVFVMDGATGAYVRFSPERLWHPVFANDGRRAFWFAPQPRIFGGEREPDLAVARFDGGRPSIEEIPLTDPGDCTHALAVDASGSRVLLGGLSSVALIDVGTGRTLARAHMSRVVLAGFRPDGTLHLLQDLWPGAGPAGSGPGGFAQSAWDPSRGSLTPMWRHEMSGGARLLAARGAQAFATANGRDGLVIDLESGVQKSIEGPEAESSPGTAPELGVPMSPMSALFLSDGRLAVSLGGELRLVGTHDSRVLVSLGAGEEVSGLAETAPGELAVGLGNVSLPARRTLFVNTATGAISHEERGLVPARTIGMGQASAEAGSFASRLFVNDEGALMERKPDGGWRVVVAGRELPRARP
jgi:hypothetical protein